LQLPDFPPMPTESLEAITERHNLRAEEISPLKEVGIFNAIYLVGRPPQPGRSWAERPAAMLLEVTRFFLGSPGRPWTDLYGGP
jgi:hypothetical protein